MENATDLIRAERKQRLIDATPELFEGIHRANLSVPSGWYDLVGRLFLDLRKLIEQERIVGFKVIQVKEKFGGLRVYVHPTSSQIADRISLAEAESFATCEMCGSKNARPRSPDGWVHTLCDDHDLKKGG